MTWLKRLLIPLLLVAHGLAYADDGWEPLEEPLHTYVPEGKVEVIEFFMYRCPHCFHLEDHLNAWLEKKPENIAFTKVPWVVDAAGVQRAHYFYAAESLGVSEQLNPALFKALDVINGKMRNIKNSSELTMSQKQQQLMALGRELSDKKTLIDFAVKQGVDRQKFTDTWESMSVKNTKVPLAIKLKELYKVGNYGVPLFFVDGKYMTNVGDAGSYEKLFEIIEQLAAKRSNSTP